MTTETAVFEEIKSHFDLVNFGWDGRVVTAGGHNCERLEIIPNRYDCVSLMLWLDGSVVALNEIVQSIVKFMARSKTKPVQLRFDLAEPDSIERLLVFLDSWTEAWG